MRVILDRIFTGSLEDRVTVLVGVKLGASGVEGVCWFLVCWPGRGDGYDGEQESDDGEESHFRFGGLVEGFSTGF